MLSGLALPRWNGGCEHPCHEIFSCLHACTRALCTASSTPQRSMLVQRWGTQVFAELLAPCTSSREASMKYTRQYTLESLQGFRQHTDRGKFRVSGLTSLSTPPQCSEGLGRHRWAVLLQHTEQFKTCLSVFEVSAPTIQRDWQPLEGAAQWFRQT